MTNISRTRKRRIEARDFVEGLPPTTGTSYRGPARLVLLEDYADEAVVEIVPDAKGEEYSLLDQPLIKGQPAYAALAGLSEACSPGPGLGEEALSACYSPSPEVQETVRWFVSRFGLLAWGGRLHDCYETENTIGELFKGRRYLSKERSRFWAMHVMFGGGPDERQRYGNCVAWILQEALVLRRAMALWTALRRLRLSGDIKPLEMLWGRKRGSTVKLFDEWWEIGPGDRWETLVNYSVVYLGALINDHIRGQASASAAFHTGHRWRRGRRSTLGWWIKPEMTFDSPLAALWLQFYNYVLRESEAGRICRECGTPFTPRRVDQNYCSKSCGNRYRQRKYRIEKG